MNAILFPGIGYGCEKPLLYYAAKLAAARDMNVIRLAWHDLPRGIKDDPEKMALAVDIALSQAEEQLSGAALSPEDVFISKSIGTAVARRYDLSRGLGARHVFYTPVEQTFCTSGRLRAVAFHGTHDPWAETEVITAACAREVIPLYITPEGNHSLETGDVFRDLEALKRVMEQTAAFLDR